MQKNIVSILLFFLFSFAALHGQEYLVGTSRISTEPDSTLFSVALSGYGYPAEGRFSIHWNSCGDMPEDTRALAALDGKLIAADGKGGLWSGAPSGENISWKRVGSASGVRSLAVIKGRIYAAGENGQLLTRRSLKGNDKWKTISADMHINVLTALEGRLFAIDEQGELLTMDPSSRDIHWTQIGHAKDIKSLTAYGKRLFAIDGGDVLWNIQSDRKDAPWMKIGRNNGITYDILIKQIAVLNDRLYAVSKNDKLYVGSHTTDGDLSATAFAIKHKDKTVVFVGVDLTGFDYSLTDEVKSIVSRERNIPKQAILINASHTHFSPSAQAYPSWANYLMYPDTLYLDILRKGMVKAIENALDAMIPADLYFGRGTTDIGENRSSGNPEQPHDKTLDILEARNANGKVSGILFLTGCHAVFDSEGREGYTLSANFPGVTRHILREQTGVDAVFIQGCGGDINPRSSDHWKTGRQLAEDIVKVMNGNMIRITGDISYSFDTVSIPVRPWSIDSIRNFATDTTGHPDSLVTQRNIKWSNLGLEKYANGTMPDKLPEYIQTINVGNWKLVGLSREVVTEYGPAVRKIWPADIVSVAGYCNDVPSYLPNAWHVRSHVYEGYGSFFWYGQPALLPENVFDIVIHGITVLSGREQR